MNRSAGYAVPSNIKVLIHDLGARPADVLRRAGLPQDLFSRENVLLPTPDFFRLWQGLVAEVDDPLLPLRIGRAVRSEGFQPVLFAALCSPDLRMATRRMSQYKALIGPMRLVVEDAPGDALSVAFEWIEAALPPPPGLVATELVYMVALARLATRHRVEPLSITTAHPPSDVAAYADELGVPITRGARHRILFAAADARRPFLTASGAMWSAFEPDLRRRLAELDSRATTAERVKAALLEGLPSGRSTVTHVARQLAMSTRTLQRRLRREETHFQQVLAETRESLSRHYLTRTSMTATEIAFLVGFEEPNSFYRAFGMWIGKTPETVRQSALH